MSLFRIVFFGLLGGCGKSPSEPVAAPAAPVSTPAPATPTPNGGPSEACAREVARVCPDGMVDGCGDGRTLDHVCIAATETAGPPCTNEIARTCPDGQVDACLHTPALATTHVCVVP